MQSSYIEAIIQAIYSCANKLRIDILNALKTFQLNSSQIWILTHQNVIFNNLCLICSIVFKVRNCHGTPSSSTWPLFISNKILNIYQLNIFQHYLNIPLICCLCSLTAILNVCGTYIFINYIMLLTFNQFPLGQLWNHFPSNAPRIYHNMPTEIKLSTSASIFKHKSM